jgi:hypothetical protein
VGHLVLREVALAEIGKINPVIRFGSIRYTTGSEMPPPCIAGFQCRGRHFLRTVVMELQGIQI